MKFKLVEDIELDKQSFVHRFEKFTKNVIKDVNSQPFMLDSGCRVSYVSYYNFKGTDWLGVFVKSHQRNKKTFPIAINYNIFYEAYNNKELTLLDVEFNIEDTIYHEVGHGIYNLFRKDLSPDEEQVVEEFAMYMTNGYGSPLLLDKLYGLSGNETTTLKEEVLNEDVGFDNDQLHQLSHILPITQTGTGTYR